MPLRYIIVNFSRSHNAVQVFMTLWDKGMLLTTLEVLILQTCPKQKMQSSLRTTQAPTLRLQWWPQALQCFSQRTTAQALHQVHSLGEYKKKLTCLLYDSLESDMPSPVIGEKGRCSKTCSYPNVKLLKCVKCEGAYHHICDGDTGHLNHCAKCSGDFEPKL